jgi:hypothetical protein
VVAILNMCSLMFIFRSGEWKFTTKSFCVYTQLLREERRLWVFENRAVRRMFVLKRDEVTGK